MVSKESLNLESNIDLPVILENNLLFSKPQYFEKVADKLDELDNAEFKTLRPRQKFKRINQQLLQLIDSAKGTVFLLPDVIHYLHEVNQRNLLDEPLNLALFEFWLNQYSNIEAAKQHEVRAKIAGKFIPREEYQVFFPIGMNKFYEGTHFVVAHLSPDIDTMIASFWGWLDAFAAKVGTAQHLWSLPGGPPASPVTELFKKHFGNAAFIITARTGMTLSLNAKDLVTQKNLAKEKSHISISALDHGFNDKAVILTNEHDQFLGDWHSSDAELVRQVIILFKSCLRWFESNLQQKLIALFAKPLPSREDVPDFLMSVFDVKIASSEPAREFSERQKTITNAFLTKVLKIPEGIEASFSELGKALRNLGAGQLTQFEKRLDELKSSDMFDAHGHLSLDRPKIFERIEKILVEFDKTIHDVRDFSERLDVAMQIKEHVLESPTTFLTIRSDVEDIRLKMKNADFLTVTVPDGADKLYPVGIVRASDLLKPTLGTVSLRDFCNQDEMRLANYLSIISVIDHHKSSLKTPAVPLAILGDAQSCNVLIAEIAFQLNDRYSLGGMTAQVIEDEIKNKLLEPATAIRNRLLQRLLTKQQALQKTGNTFFIDARREYLEYFFFLHAILDDTDLLTKVSNRDVFCVQELLNRIKSLQLKNIAEAIDLSDLPNDDNFAKNAAKKILQNEDMHAIYAQVYALKEKEVEENLLLCGQGNVSTIFSDTKEQNGCCRVGQTKLFSTNIASYKSLRPQIIKNWLDSSIKINKNRPEIDLFLHMLSTIPSAEEVYKNISLSDGHEDEMWIWKPGTQGGYEHLSVFLSAFQASPKVQQNPMHVEFYGKDTRELQEIFSRNFIKTPMKVIEEGIDEERAGESLAVLKYRAGLLNSRKAMVSPYLPKSINNT